MTNPTRQDSSITASVGAVTSLTSNAVTVSAGSGLALFAFVYVNDGSPPTFSAVKLDSSSGTDFSLVDSQTVGGQKCAWYRLTGVSTGSHSVYVSFSAAPANAGVILVAVQDYSTTGTAVTANGSGSGASQPSVNASTASGDLVLDGVGWHIIDNPGANIPIVGANQTVTGHVSINSDTSLFGSMETATGATTTMSWSDNGGGTTANWQWLQIAIPLRGASGGTTTQKTMEDTVTVSDARVSGALRGKVVSDTLTLTDAIVKFLRRGRIMEDALTISDAIIKVLRLRRLMEDLLTISDGIVKSVQGASQTFTKVMSDTLTILEGNFRYLFARRFNSDQITVQEEGWRWITVTFSDEGQLVVADEELDVLRLARQLSDSVSVSDGTSIWRRLGRSLTDALTISDSVVTIRRLRRTLGDDLILIDQIVRSVNGAGGTVYTRINSDSVEVIDAESDVILMTRMLSDVVTTSDQLQRLRLCLRTLGDTLEIADGSTRMFRYQRTFSDLTVVQSEIVKLFLPSQIYSVDVVLGSDDDSDPVLGGE